MSKSRRLPGGYIDRDNLDKAITANAEMARIVVQVSDSHIPPGLAVPLMKFAALLNEQSGHLHQMRNLRPEPEE